MADTGDFPCRHEDRLVRAQALGPRGQLVDDFKIEATERAIHVLNAPSPAATASLAIGEHVAELAANRFALAD